MKDLKCVFDFQIRICFDTENISGVARAFPGGRLAHPEGQNEEENK